jgi:tRNA threonylcarbamoyl adenosine modification protein (Sua5/YciO/YrdC/YwlC family)
VSQFFKIHPNNPQLHLLRQVATLLMKGGLIIYPTDSAYALGCEISNREGIQRLRRIRKLDDRHSLTLLCRDLSELARYARLENSVFRLIKANSPGPYTFLLPASSEVPRYISNTKRKTVGVRIPDNKIVLALLEMLDKPLISSTLILAGSDLPLLEPEAMRDMLGNQVDLIIDGGPCGLEPSTVIDLVDGWPRVVRKGKGDIAPFQSGESSTFA